MKRERYIVHVDMDAFFAAIEQRDNPKYRSRPVVIGADPKSGKGRGVVSTCSYEARRFGIHSAMPISEAFRRCPGAAFLPVNMDKYLSVSAQVLFILRSFTPDIEPVSIDEAYLDITGSYRLFAQTPADTCRKIKNKINAELSLTASLGLGPTMMAAKIASDLNKPDGFVEVTRNGLISFLRPLSVRRLWGLGPKTERILNDVGISTIGQLADSEPSVLREYFGNSADHFWKMANGFDDRSITVHSEAKSYSNETTFDKDTSCRNDIEGALMSLCENVSSRMRRNAVRCRTATLKIRLSDFATYTRSTTFRHATNYSDLLYKAVISLYNNFATEGKRIRLLGVKASGLSGGGEKELFIDESDAKAENVHLAIDKIADKFGDEYICRATSTYFTGTKGQDEKEQD